METSKRLREKTNHQICEENNINGLLLTNVVDESVSKNKIRATLQIIAKTLSSTLGPDGSTTILQDAQRQHLVTKDGLDVISRITFEDELARTVLEMVKSISRNQVVAVGDGSTSAVIVANALYQEFTAPENKEIFEYVSPKVIVDILNYLSNFLDKALKENAIPLSDDLHELEQIASVAMNNDAEVGKMVADIYRHIGKYGFSSTDTKEAYDNDVVEYKRGIRWTNGGYIHGIFAEKYPAHKITHEKPVIFMIDSPITINDIDPLIRPLLKQVCAIENKQLVIVCNNINEEAKMWCLQAREAYKLGKSKEMLFTIVDLDKVTDVSNNYWNDLALLCGCKVYNKKNTAPTEVSVRLDPAYTKEDKEMFLGHAVKAIITKDTTEIICDDSLLTPAELEAKNNAIIEINENLELLTKKSNLSNEDRALLQLDKQRKSNLENRTAIVHVGGKTYDERVSRERLFEDALLASKSALDYGYIVGGNIMIPRLLEANKEKLAHELKEEFSYIEQNLNFFRFFVELLRDGFLQSYRAVLENSYILTDEKINSILNVVLTGDRFYNLRTHKYEKFNQTKVINSLNTDLQIMKSCISLMGLLATSNQVITLNYNITDQVR